MNRSENEPLTSAEPLHLCFAYGSNLDERVMEERCPSAEVLVLATLPDHVLRFVGWSKVWMGGVATARPSSGDNGGVRGVIYRLTTSDLQLLDRREGHPGTYERVELDVQGDDGTTRRPWVYLRRREVVQTLPSADYLARIRAGYLRFGFDQGPLVEAIESALRAAQR